MKHIDSDGSPTTGESELAARKLAAQILGFLVAGALFFPIGILHGFFIWFR